MKAIIFGAAGQDGHYLSELLRSYQINVIGVSRTEGYVQVDITDYDQVARSIQLHQPAYVFHLAANSSTNHKFLLENHETIATGTLNILEAVKIYSSGTKVFIPGSGLQFENKEQPIRETDPFEASSAYAVSRIQTVYAARYFRNMGVRAYVGYFFNHDSPRRSENHLTKKISETARRIARGSSEKLQIGDIYAVKEYGFAGDIVKGVWTLVNQEEVFECNISTGDGYTVEHWLRLCFSIAGKNWEDHVEQNPGYISPYKKLVSDPSRIFSLGWKPGTSVDALAQMMMTGHE